MHSLFVLARIEIEVFLVALTLIVGFQLLTRKMNTKGMLFEKEADKNHDEKADKKPDEPVSFSPARLQMLLITLAGAFYLISGVTTNIHQGKLEFPDVDSRVFLLLGGSHTIYLGGKLNSFFKWFGKSDT